MFLPGSHFSFLNTVNLHSYLSCLCPDPETSREEGQIPIRRDEYGKTCNTTPQAKEEGCQDGLKD